jgi:predicted lysophospholipase L1 biosynthesis ABC-type transport system permease subunit
MLVNHVSHGHFRTLGIALLQGRDFTAQDDARAPRVAIVNQTVARRLWPGESAVGRLVRLGGESATVIAVVRDSKYESLVEAPKAMVYRPLAQATTPGAEATLLLKTEGDRRTAFALARALVAALDPDLVISNLNTFDDRLNLAFLPNRAAAVTSGLLGLVALFLGAIGTYSVMALLVLQRRREIGIRIALGALPRAVVGLITRQGLRSTVIGLAIGTAAGLGALLLVRGLIAGVPANDPVAIVLVPVALAVVSYLACRIPARHAVSTDPLAVLRE